MNEVASVKRDTPFKVPDSGSVKACEKPKDGAKEEGLTPVGLADGDPTSC